MFKYENALDAYVKSAEMRVHQNTETTTSLDPSLVECYMKAGSTSLTLKDAQNALNYFNRVVSLFKAAFGGLADDLELARALNSIGVAYQNQGEVKLAFDYKMKSYEMRKRVLAKLTDHADLAESLDSLGAAHEELGDLKRALELKTAALDMRNRIYEGVSHHAEIAESLISIAKTNERMGHFKAASENYLKGLLIKKQLFSDEDPSIFDLHNLLAQVNLKEQKEHHHHHHINHHKEHKETTKEHRESSKPRKGLTDKMLKGFFSKNSHYQS